MAGEGAPDIETLLELVRRPEGHRWAACRGMATDAFFLVRGQSLDAAKAVCGRREVWADCLESALAGGDKHSIWAA